MKITDIEASLIHHCGSDLTTVNAARVSFDKESKELDASDVSLINYLANHEHTSPFNHAFLTFRVKAPIFVARQLVKHKFMPWNEVSRRYVNSEPEFYIPDYFRGKSADKKQGSVDKPVWGSYTTREWVYTIDKNALTLYNDMLLMGIAPEQARMVLPLNVMTEWYWSGTLGAWLNMLRLRLGADAQKECREVAAVIGAKVYELFPNSFAAVVGEDMLNEAFRVEVSG